jgi:dihydroorotase
MNALSRAQFKRAPALSVADAQPANLVIRGALLLDPAAGIEGAHDLVVRDGRIAEIAPPGAAELPPGCELIDGSGLHIFPAFVDPHVHLRTPGREDEEDIESGTRAAAAGGFYCVLAMPNTDPVCDSASIVRSLHQRARAEARVRVGFLAAATKGQHGRELTEMAELADEGAVGFSDDGVPIADAHVLRRALQYQRLSGGVLALHEEDPALSGNGVMHEGAISTMLGLAGIPSISESTMVERDIQVARFEAGRLHMLHLSAAESVTAVARAKSDGVAVTAEVTPHHLTLVDEAVITLDPLLKMNPPLRSESDRLALIDGLRSGVIDCVATDHAPHSREEKEQPFEQAPMGTIGLETAFAALYTELVIPGVIGLELLIERMIAGAAVYGLPAPSLAKGSPANLCLVDLEGIWRVGESGYESRSQNSCFWGRSLHGRVLVTVADGGVAYRERGFAIRLAENGGRRLAGAREEG